MSIAYDDIFNHNLMIVMVHRPFDSWGGYVPIFEKKYSGFQNLRKKINLLYHERKKII